MKEHPVKLLDDWIEKHNSRIEWNLAWDGYSEAIMVAVNLLSEVVDFFNTPPYPKDE